MGSNRFLSRSWLIFVYLILIAYLILRILANDNTARIIADIAFGFLAIAMGILLIRYREPFGRFNRKKNAAFGVGSTSPSSLRFYTLTFLVVGVMGICGGILLLLGVASIADIMQGY